VETSETERWQNGKMKTTAAKNIRCWIMKLCKKKFLASRLQRPVAARNDVIAKKLASGLFQNLSGRPEDWTASGPCHLQLPLLKISARVFSLDLGFFYFIWVSGILTKNLGFFDSGQILEMYVVLVLLSIQDDRVPQT